MSIHTTPGATARRRLAGLLALPVLVITAACGADGDGDAGAKDAGVASAPEAADGNSKGAARDTGKQGSEGSEGSIGSNGSKGTGANKARSAFYDAQLKYVQCMRGKAGVEDFPDPKLSGYLDWAKIDEVVDPDGNGEEYKGGKDGVCVPELRAAMNLEPERDAQKDYESMLAHAKCMRENGLSKFTNPTMSGGNVMPGGEPNPTDPTMDRDSPAYKEAREACKGKLLEGLDGMQ